MREAPDVNGAERILTNADVDAIAAMLEKRLSEQLVRLAPEPADALCKTYAIEKKFQVKRRNGGFA